MFKKKFVLTDVCGHYLAEFGNPASREQEPRTYFGVPWNFVVKRTDEHLDVYLKCNRKKDETIPWSIDATITVKWVENLELVVKKQQTTSYTFTNDSASGFEKFVSCRSAYKHFASLLRCEVVIEKMAGFAAKKCRNFDEPVVNVTDVILKVEDQKFHVSKAVLVNQSPYFEALFSGNFREANMPEIELKETAVDGFQSFLEIIYGDSEITAHNVADLLILADKFDVQSVRNLCEEFLLGNDQVNKKEKLRIADAFKLDNLMNHCVKYFQNSVDDFLRLRGNMDYLVVADTEDWDIIYNHLLKLR